MTPEHHLRPPDLPALEPQSLPGAGVIDELDLSVALVAPEDREVVRAVAAGGVRGADFR